jgi:uncharacterized protein (DUF885 family)
MTPRLPWVLMPLLLAACSPSPAPTAAPTASAPAAVATADASARVLELADAYVDALVAYDPSPAYYVDLGLKRHDGFPKNARDARLAWEAQEDDFIEKLDALPADAVADRNAQVVRAQLAEILAASRGLRVCKQYGWAVSQMDGWHLNLADLANRQPVSTAEERAQALARWKQFPAFIAVEVDNLREGLAAGYSVPRTVVARVLTQLDGSIVEKPADSPFYTPATHTEDAEFRAAFATLITDEIQPALARYREFLKSEYQPKARETLALTALPDGEACYAAQLRRSTTLDRTPRAVYELGERTVAANEETVSALGEKLFGTRDIATIIARTDAAPENKFASADEQVAFSRALLERARTLSAPFFAKMPSQPATVEPFPPHQRGSGLSSHYEVQPDDSKPGIYRINLDHPDEDRRGTAEITLVHEAWPGHHLQIALARGIGGGARLSQLAFNAAYVEGWARYSEALAEEAGIYQTAFAPISRRIWPARGMVVDPGIHLFGWTRQQAVDYLVASGRFAEEEAEATVDRIAVLPGQLTSYDSGGLEIMALRREAEQALGAKFDIREFHSRILDDGMVPLPLLRSRVEAWIAAAR